MFGRIDAQDRLFSSVRKIYEIFEISSWVNGARQFGIGNQRTRMNLKRRSGFFCPASPAGHVGIHIAGRVHSCVILSGR
jgi:hypothetical protein